MNRQQSESNNEQGTNLVKGEVNNRFSDPFFFYKTLNEFPKHEKLIASKSMPQIIDERPQTARAQLLQIEEIVEKEEKAINTSRVEKIPTVSDKVNDLVNCPICLDMIEDAMETPC